MTTVRRGSRGAALILGWFLLAVTAGSAIAQGGGWQLQNLPALPSGSTYHLTAVSALNENDVWVGGYIQPSKNVFVARTANGGASWQVVHESTIGSINRMRMLSSASGYIGGSYGTFRSTGDGGATWVQEMSGYPDPSNPHAVGPDGHVYGMAVADGTHVWTCGWDGYGAGIIYHRVPERPNDPQHPNYNIPWWLEWAQNYQGMYGMAAASANVAWSVGFAGAIWATVNGGDGWGPQTSGTGASLNDVVAIDENTAWAVGESGTIIKTTNGGTTWVGQTSNTSEGLRRIAAVNANVAWAVGASGTILHTTDGGTTWEPQYSGTREMLQGVAATDANTAWVVGENNVLIATTDGGSGAWAAPTITSVSPEVLGYQPSTDEYITVTGTGFRGGNLTAFVGSEPSLHVVWIGPTTVAVRAPAGLLGRYGLTITNEDGQSAALPDAVFYLQRPVTTTFSPLHGPVSGGYQVTINGYGLQTVTGASLYIISPDEPYTTSETIPVTVVSPNQVVVTIPPSAGRLRGQGYITVTTAQRQEAYASVFVLDPPGGPEFAIDSISPQSGGMNTIITINGVGFSPAATVTIYGWDVPVLSQSATQIVVKWTHNDVGWLNVRVLNESADIDVYKAFLAGSFVTPTISHVSPPSGPAAGNTSVTITGTGFSQTGYVMVSFGGYQAEVTSKTGTTLVVKTPPHAGGPVDVNVVLLSYDFGDPVTAAGIAAGGFLYEPEGSARSDFDGDGTSDVLWRGTGGDLWLWGVQSAAHATDAYVGIVADSNWEIRGQGDLDGDGTADLLWRHKLDGTVYYWRMVNGAPAAELYVATVDVAYDIVGTGDFDGDGKADILWRNPAVGDLWLWRMHGAAILGQSYVDTVALSYAIKGLGDLNGDTRTDVVWQGAAGDLWAWLMNGAVKDAQSYVGTVADATYQIQQVADFDADQKADLLWWNTIAGDVWIWRMNGATVASQHYVGIVSDTHYRIQAAGDYNGDGKADILWRNLVAGDLWVWLMNGPVKASEVYLGIVAEQGYQIVR